MVLEKKMEILQCDKFSKICKVTGQIFLKLVHFNNNLFILIRVRSGIFVKIIISISYE